MAASVEFFFDIGSPTSYLAYTQIPKIAGAAGARLVWRAMLLGGVFKATGNQSPAMIPAKGAYMNADLNRFARRYGVPLAFNPHFPVNTLQAMRVLTAAEDEGIFTRTADCLFNAMWVSPRKLDDPAVLKETLSAAGLDAQRLLARAEESAVKERLKATTEEAIRRGAFGAPTFFVGDEMFFGQDRLDFVAEALAR